MTETSARNVAIKDALTISQRSNATIIAPKVRVRRHAVLFAFDSFPFGCRSRKYADMVRAGSKTNEQRDET